MNIRKQVVIGVMIAFCGYNCSEAQAQDLGSQRNMTQKEQRKVNRASLRAQRKAERATARALRKSQKQAQKTSVQGAIQGVKKADLRKSRWEEKMKNKGLSSEQIAKRWDRKLQKRKARQAKQGAGSIGVSQQKRAAKKEHVSAERQAFKALLKGKSKEERKALRAQRKAERQAQRAARKQKRQEERAVRKAQLEALKSDMPEQESAQTQGASLSHSMNAMPSEAEFNQMSPEQQKEEIKAQQAQISQATLSVAEQLME